jgi:hypothetical protein
MICSACGFPIWHTAAGAICRCGQKEGPLPPDPEVVVDCDDAPEIVSLTVSEARDKAETMLGPVWFERARTVLFSLTLEGHPERAAALRFEQRTIRDATSARQRAALSEHFRLFPYWRLAAPGPLAVEAAERSRFVRVLTSTWKPEDPPFPSPTAWAYFDVGMGWTDPTKSNHESGWRSLVASWQTELRKVGLASANARNRGGGSS